MADPLHLSAEYDEIADVMYITLGRDEPNVEAIEDAEGFVWRYTADGRLVGVTLLDYHYRFHTPFALAGLINQIAARLNVTQQEARKVLEDA